MENVEKPGKLTKNVAKYRKMAEIVDFEGISKKLWKKISP